MNKLIRMLFGTIALSTAVNLILTHALLCQKQSSANADSVKNVKAEQPLDVSDILATLGNLQGNISSDKINTKKSVPTTPIPVKISQEERTFMAIDSAHGKRSGATVAIGDNKKIYRQIKEQWTDIHQNFEGTPAEISISGDDSLWALNDKGQIFRKKDNGWDKIPGQLRQISVGNKHEVWGVNSTFDVLRKINPTSSNNVGTGSWHKIPGGKFIDIACSGDGKIWAVGKTDARIYKFSRKRDTWKMFFDSSHVGIGTPLRIKIADQFNIMIMNQKGEVWRLTPGAKGNIKSDWELIPNYRFLDATIGTDGTIMGIDMNGTLMSIDPADNEGALLKQIEEARGNEVQTNQVIRMHSKWDGRRLWTHGFSPYDPNSDKAIPENHIEVLAGVTSPLDRRQDIGSLFMMSDPSQPNASKALRYGDPVEIWSLYSCLGHPKKSGGRGGKEWKWWVNDNHHRWGKNWGEVIVSLIRHPKTRDGSQRFAIVSPYGRTGVVRSNDVVTLVSLAPHTLNQPIFIHQWSSLEGGSYELLIPKKNNDGSWGDATHPYGDYAHSGKQLLQLQAVTSQQDIPDFAQSAYRKALGLEVETAGIEGGPEKENLLIDTSAGKGLLMEFENRTNFPLETSIGIVKPKETKDQINFSMDKLFEFSGFAERGVVPNFGTETFLELNKLYSKGVAWIQESFSPNNTTLTFIARAGDQGNIQVVFGDSAGTSHLFRIHIGMEKNSKSAIIVGDKIFAEADGNTNPIARVIPGRPVPYWVTLNNNFLMVGGRGITGENVFLSCYLPLDASNVNRVGFSTHKGKVEYAEVQFGDAIIPRSVGYTYENAKQQDFTLPAQQEVPTFLKQKLRVPNEGTLSFDVKANHTVTFLLATDNEKEMYKVVFGTENNSSAYIIKNGQKALRVDIADSPYGKVFSDRTNSYWISINGGKIMVGANNPGTDPFIIWQDDEPLQNVTKVGFMGTDHAQKISNLFMSPPIEMGTKKEKITYNRTIPRYKYEGSIYLIEAFDFLAVQSGQRISLKDMLEGSTTPVLPTPQQGSTVKFKIITYADGTPQFLQTEEAEKSKELKELESSAKIKNAAGDASLQAASAISLGGADMFSGLTAISLGMGLSSAGIGLKTEAAKAQAKATSKYRSPYSFVLVDQFTKEKGISIKIPPKVEENAFVIQTLVAQSRELVALSAEDFVRLIKAFQTILRQLTHPYAIEDVALRDTLYSMLDEMLAAYSQHPVALQEMFMNVLIDAYQNPYLSSDEEKTERARRNRWYYAIVEIGKQLLMMSSEAPITIQPLQGEYLWFPIPLEFDDSGWITFEAKAQNDIFISFATAMEKVRDTDNRIYELVIGGYENTQHEIRIKSLGRPAVTFNRENMAIMQRGKKATDLEFKRSMLSPTRFEKYWVSLKNGELRLGKGEPGKNTLMKWQDPFPWSGIRYVGVSNWDTPIQIRNFQLGSFGPVKQAPRPSTATYTPPSTTDKTISSLGKSNRTTPIHQRPKTGSSTQAVNTEETTSLKTVLPPTPPPTTTASTGSSSTGTGLTQAQMFALKNK